MKKKIIIAIKTLLVIVLTAFVVVHKSRTPRILVIHSYNIDYAWVRDINLGLKRVFDKHYDITFRFHYMDLKNHIGEDFQRRAQEAAHKLIQSWQPDVLILFDDLAQKLVGTQYVKQNEPIQVIFGGVSHSHEDYGYDGKDNVTGILERKPLQAIKAILERIAFARGFDLNGPGTKPKVAFLGTRSYSINAEIGIYNTFDWSPLIWVAPTQVETYEQWLDSVKLLSRSADILLVSNYRKLSLKSGGNKLASSKEVMAATQQTFKRHGGRLPVVGMNYFNVEDGGALAVGTSPYEQGDIAAKMAIRVAREKMLAGQIDIVQSKQFIVAIRKKELDLWEIQLPPVYEAFARATDNYWD